MHYTNFGLSYTYCTQQTKIQMSLSSEYVFSQLCTYYLLGLGYKVCSQISLTNTFDIFQLPTCNFKLFINVFYIYKKLLKKIDYREKITTVC